jgi:putative phage-type endonuclease
LDVFLSKTQTEEVVSESISEPAYWGNALEDPVARKYSEVTGYKVYSSAGVMRHPMHNFIGANVDRWVSDDKGEKRVLECKTTHFLKAKEWGEPGTDQIPATYLYQVAYYAAVCNVEKVDIAVLIGGQDFRIYKYRKNSDFEQKLIQAACAFWNKYVAKDIAPEPTIEEYVSTLYPRSNGRSIKADEEILQSIEELKSFKEKEREIVRLRQDIESKLKVSMGEYESIIDKYGYSLATWKSGKSRQVLDGKKLSEENEDMYQKYLTTKEGSRVFLVK